MKALTLTQPWATLVALGEKKIETRSWYTSYRGPLAIHAAIGFPGWAKSQCFQPEFAVPLSGYGLSPDDLPRGRVLCVTELEECIETRAVDMDQLTLRERAFGNFDYGRFAWFLGPVSRTFEPAPYAKGKLGLWDWRDA